jgi:hypothetical protein
MIVSFRFLFLLVNNVTLESDTNKNKDNKIDIIFIL